MSKEKLKIVLGYAIICLIWGSTWLAIRIGLDSLTPLFSCGTRFLIASLFIYTIMRFRGVKLQTDAKSIKLYIVMGILSFVFPFGLVYWAEQFIASGLTSVLFAVHPFFVIVWSRIISPEHKVGPYQVLGVVLGFLGILVIFLEGLSINLTEDFWAMVAVIASGIMQAWIAVFMKKHGNYLHPLSMNLVPIFLAGISLVFISFVFEDRTSWVFDNGAVFSILYLAFFGTVTTFTIFYWLLKRISVVIISLTSFITPIIAVILGLLILNEKFSGQTLMGSSLVLIGILFANFRE